MFLRARPRMSQSGRVVSSEGLSVVSDDSGKVEKEGGEE
jgi:hypothetical protein